MRSRKEGTCIYYYLDPQDGEIEKVIRLFPHIRRVMRAAPDRSETDEP